MLEAAIFCQVLEKWQLLVTNKLTPRTSQVLKTLIERDKSLQRVL